MSSGESELRQRQGPQVEHEGPSGEDSTAVMPKDQSTTTVQASPGADVPAADTATGKRSKNKRRSERGDDLPGFHDPSQPIGVTDDGVRFRVAPTKSVWEAFILSKWGLGEKITVYLLALHLVLFLLPLPRGIYLGLFVFWRLGYDLFLGFMLDRQSRTRWLTKLFQSQPIDGGFHKFIERIVAGSLPDSFCYKDYPAAFTAWLAFRVMANVVLINDLMAYGMFCYKYGELPNAVTWGVLAQYLLGFSLLVFNAWVKIDAHRVVKDLAWYWGDFFFLTNQALTFDGVFQIVPHPMYTVGYAFFYGMSLIFRSYTVLYVSLFGHICQLLFLHYVENPHIARTYGEVVQEIDAARRTILYDTKSGFFRRDLIVFHNLDLTRSSDVFMLVILAQSLMLMAFDVPITFYFVQIAVWRVILNVVLGAILHAQSTSRWWTRQWERRGESKQAAFESWKSLYNLAVTMNHMAFIMAAYQLSHWPSTRYDMAQLVIGSCLIALNIWSSISMFEVLGPFGWFYGDFFIDEVPRSLYYTGIYRFLNNPDSVIGFFAYYGLSLITDSWELLFLALASQIGHWMFVRLVEQPHMQQLYGNKVQAEGGAHRAIKETLKESLKDTDLLKKTTHIVDHLEDKTLKVTETVLDKLGAILVPGIADADDQLAAPGGVRYTSPTPSPNQPRKGKKVNKQATTPVPPDTVTESTVLALVEDVLEDVGLSVEDDLFAIGMTSLKAARLCARVSAACQVRMKLPMLYGNPTVRSLAQVVDTLRGTSTPPSCAPRSGSTSSSTSRSSTPPCPMEGN